MSETELHKKRTSIKIPSTAASADINKFIYVCMYVRNRVNSVGQKHVKSSRPTLANVSE